MINYKQIYAKKKAYQEQIRTMCPDVRERSGIYLFYRIDEKGIKHAYVGKAEKNLLSRMADHLSGYDQHIDKSIRKYGIYNVLKNQYGYMWKVLAYCQPSECNALEEYYIKLYADMGYQLKNTQSGGAGGRININDNKTAKGYYDGLKQGYKNAQRDVVKWFDKSLDYTIKGKPNKNKEKAFNRFKEFLGGTDNEISEIGTDG